MVFHPGNEYFVARADALAKRVGNQVDGFCRASGEHDFAARPGIDEPGYLVAGPFIGVGRAMAECMHPAMHIRMIMAVIVTDRIDDRLRPLR